MPNAYAYPTTDNVPATTLTVNATDAANAINYQAANVTFSGSGLVFGKVTVDNQVPMAFSQKTNLVINGLAGGNVINLNDPTQPTGLTGSITVNGGVTDEHPRRRQHAGRQRNGGDSTIEFTPASANSGGITGVGPVAVNFATIEQVEINGQASGNGLVVYTPIAGLNTITYNPGSTVDSGSVQITSLSAGSLVPIGSSNLGLAAYVGVDNLVTADDTLVYNGTPLNDTFTVAASGNVTLNSVSASGDPL